MQLRKKKGQRTGEKAPLNFPFTNLLSLLQKQGFILQNSDTKERLLSEMQIISLQVGKTCCCISINFFYSKLPTTGGRVWVQCILYLATAVNRVHAEMLKRHYLSQLSHTTKSSSRIQNISLF